MKKVITSVTVCSLAVCALASCGSSAKKSADKIVGKWAMSDLSNTDQSVDGGGIIFTDGGKGSVYLDTSSLLHFESEGLNVGGTVLAKDYIKEEGKTLTVDVMGQEMIGLTKLESGEGYDGKYSLDSGILYDSIVQGMEKQGDSSFDKSNLDITIDFDGSKSEVVFNNLFTYETKGKKLTVSGFSGFLSGGDGKEATAEFKVDGDTLELKDSKSTETLTRVK
ncbi:hypothetical protein [uncultured Ruminococcus sp.]|jgi:hypothetical protein|uniref:hypothetical protein n=1 Tax=uncultured Ruminococcus sp. TaxID=165186 RepID=UPI0025CD40E7|nr:hypothetical protein [uncultured Ruminococcus sp.]